MSTGPSVSVVIPTKNGARNIGDCLRSISQSTYLPYEVIVVDGLSADNTTEIAQRLGARVVRGTGSGRAADCNVGIAEAKGEVFALTDDDCVVDARWLERLASSFQDERVGISGGPDLTYLEDTTAVGRAAGHIHYFYRALATSTGADAVIGCNSAYRRRAIVEAGGFDGGLVGAEDTSLHARILSLGYIARPDPRCIVYHKRRSKLGTLVRRYWTYGWHMGLAYRRNPLAFKERRRHIFPLVGALPFFVLLGLLGLYFPVLLWAFPFPLFAYAAFMLLLHRALVRRTGFGSCFAIFLLASSGCMLAYALGFTKEQLVPAGRLKAKGSSS